MDSSEKEELAYLRRESLIYQGKIHHLEMENEKLRNTIKLQGTNDPANATGEEKERTALKNMQQLLVDELKECLEQRVSSLCDSRPVATSKTYDDYIICGKSTSALLEDLSQSSDHQNCDTISRVIHLTFSMAHFLLQAKELARSLLVVIAANKFREESVSTAKAAGNLAQMLGKQFTCAEIQMMATEVLASLQEMDNVVLGAKPGPAPPPPPLPTF